MGTVVEFLAQQWCSFAKLQSYSSVLCKSGVFDTSSHTANCSVRGQLLNLLSTVFVLLDKFIKQNKKKNTFALQ